MPPQSKSLIRTGELVVTAIASDEELLERLVLKGGNALQLVHKLGARASKDFDFSMEDDISDVAQLAARLESALIRRFEIEGYRIFDFTCQPRPSINPNPQVPQKWGGYEVHFKFLANSSWRDAEDEMRKRAAKREKRAEERGGTVDSRSPMTEASLLQFRRNIAESVSVDISKFEYTQGKIEAEVDGYPVYVYSLPMIAAEKLRAICQQMTEYTQRKHPAPRPRDFYDIHSCVMLGKVELVQHGYTIRGMFNAKDVPLALLDLLEYYRSFHRTNWASVEQDVPAELLKPYDYYFDFVLNEVAKLKAAGVV
jgi:predicted nucleotidyltransferase component of viral defense system